MKLEFLPVKTRLVRSPKDEIWDILDGLDVRELKVPLEDDLYRPLLEVLPETR